MIAVGEVHHDFVHVPGVARLHPGPVEKLERRITVRLVVRGRNESRLVFCHAVVGEEQPVAVEVNHRDHVLGRVCVELVAPYPPGIPVLAPGEEVTGSALDALAQARADGVRIAYAADPTLATLRVAR